MLRFTTSSSIHNTHQKCALLRYYGESSGIFLPTFRDMSALEDGTDSCPETSVSNYYSSLRNSPEEHNSHLIGGGSLKSNIYLAQNKQFQKLKLDRTQ